MRLSAVLFLAVAAPAAANELTLEGVLAAAQPSVERLAAESFLAAAARELSQSRGIALGGVAVTAEAGPRSSPEASSTDFSVGFELPLAGDPSASAAARDLFAETKPVLLAAAELEAGLELRLAYVDAWEATEALELARRQAASAESWLEVVEARVAAGAEAPYETSLVGAEVGLARLAVAEARAREQLAWSELQARAAVGAVPRRLAEPRPATPSAGDEAGGENDRSRLFEGTLLARAVELRSALTLALVNLDVARGASRWSLLATAAQEGEEDVARLGVGYRLPLAGQDAARATARDAALAEQKRSAELERMRLDARLRGAEERAEALAETDIVSIKEVEDALLALEARVTAGRDRPSTVLPLRRQLIGALQTGLAARADRARANFLIETLKAEISR